MVFLPQDPRRATTGVTDTEQELWIPPPDGSVFSRTNKYYDTAMTVLTRGPPEGDAMMRTSCRTVLSLVCWTASDVRRAEDSIDQTDGSSERATEIDCLEISVLLLLLVDY